MKRNNRDKQDYRKSTNKKGDRRSSERPASEDRTNKFSSSRFSTEEKEGQERKGKPTYKKKGDWEKNPEKAHPSWGKKNVSDWEAGRPKEGKTSYKKFSTERRDELKSGNKRDSNKSGSERTGKTDPTQYKTIYKGRGKDQKPRYETVRKEEFNQKRTPKKFFQHKRLSDNGPNETKPDYDLKKYDRRAKKNFGDEEIRLNKYIANSGVCSRRDADKLIENGLISVNGKTITELGHKVSKKDKVQYQGKTLNPEKPVYVLLNKPKDFITTTDDPMERKTVMGLVSSACSERIFPVGRLDRNTTGLLLFTNDGELAEKLASPANKIKKIYQVTLDRPLTKNDAEAILEGVTLEDGLAKVDDMQVLSQDRTILGLEIHIGRNRVVRRIFAHFGYDVVSLDRVVYAGLTKKDLPRGKYRFLSEKEVINLKFFS